MQKGVVKSFKEEEGYGFIAAEDGRLYFVHHSAIEMEGFRTLSRGDRVTFDVTVGKRGPEALKVRKL